MLPELFESMPDAVLVVDPDGRIALVNRTTEALFGYDRTELIGQSIETLVPERLRATHFLHRHSYDSSTRRRPMGTGMDLYARRKDGTEFPVDIMLNPVELEGRRLVIAVVRDTTERENFARTLRQTNAELEKARSAKDEFLAVVSHELRTPLNAVLGFASVLLTCAPGPLTDEQRRQIETVQSSGKHLLSLVSDLLDISKIESGKAGLSVEPVICQDVIAEVAAALRTLAEEKGLKLVVTLPDDQIVVHTDHRAFRQILHNLIGNAIKFTERGKVCVETALCRMDGEEWVKTDVSDTGAGIRLEHQDELFHAFQQMEAGLAKRSSGTGLGLYVSRKLAEALGGRITFSSKFGLGSTFTLLLPVGIRQSPSKIQPRNLLARKQCAEGRGENRSRESKRFPGNRRLGSGSAKDEDHSGNIEKPWFA